MHNMKSPLTLCMKSISTCPFDMSFILIILLLSTICESFNPSPKSYKAVDLKISDNTTGCIVPVALDFHISNKTQNKRDAPLKHARRSAHTILAQCLK